MGIQNNELTDKPSSVNVTDDREARPKRWYVARVQMHCERKYAQQIAALGYETYVPVQEELRQWSDRQKKVQRVLIPLVIFFKADEAGAKQVLPVRAINYACRKFPTLNNLFNKL